jgi:tetratricopeptide (TPR) repeat protein
MLRTLKSHPRALAIGAIALVAVAASLAVAASRPRREITTRSPEAYAAYLAGMDAQRKLYAADARKAWLRAVELDSTCAMAWVRLARTSLSGGGSTGAREYLRRAEALAGRVTMKERLFIQLTRNEVARNEKECDRILSELVRKFPEDTEILFMDGIRAFRLKKYDRALESFDRLLVRAPEMGEVYNMMGYALGELERWPEAVQAFQKYAFVYPDQANPHDSLGELYLRTGRYEAALGEFAKAASLKPDFSWAHFHAAMAYAETGRHEMALASIRAAVKASAGSPELLRSWRRQEVFFEMAAGNHDRALHLAERIREKEADEPLAHFMVGRVQASRGRPDLARADLSRMVEALVKLREEQSDGGEADSSGLAQLHELEGEIAMADGHPEEAVPAFQKAGKQADAWWVRRRILLKQVECQVRSGRAEDAARAIQEHLGVNPGDPAFHYWHGEALAALGKAPEAAAAFRRTVELLSAADPGFLLFTAAARRLEEVPAPGRFEGRSHSGHVEAKPGPARG